MLGSDAGWQGKLFDLIEIGGKAMVVIIGGLEGIGIGNIGLRGSGNGPSGELSLSRLAYPELEPVRLCVGTATGRSAKPFFLENISEMFA